MLKFGACDFLIRWALVVIYFTLQKTCKACIEADGYVRDKGSLLSKGGGVSNEYH